MLFGCVGRLVVAVVLLIAGAALWHFRAHWVPKVKEWLGDKASEVDVELPRVGQGLPPGVRLVFATPEAA